MIKNQLHHLINEAQGPKKAKWYFLRTQTKKAAVSRGDDIVLGFGARKYHLLLTRSSQTTYYHWDSISAPVKWRWKDSTLRRQWEYIHAWFIQVLNKKKPFFFRDFLGAEPKCPDFQTKLATFPFSNVEILTMLSWITPGT